MTQVVTIFKDKYCIIYIMNCPYSDNKDDNSVVAQHAYFFSERDSNGYLTKESITKWHTVQDIISGVYVKAKAILNMLSGNSKCPTAFNIAKFRNPASTGIWDDKGNFNEEVFKYLKLLAVEYKEEQIITKELFNEFRKNIYNGKKNFGIATYIFYVIPVCWIDVTDASINELFEYYHDRWYYNEEKNCYEKAFTVEHLEKFYRAPNVVMQQRIDGVIPPGIPNDIKADIDEMDFD